MTSTTTTGAARGGPRGSGRVGVGVIGAGTISTQYLTNLTSFPDLDVRVVADLAVDRAQAQAEAFGVPRWGAVEDVLADPEVEVVVNLTIPAAHVEVATAAVTAGKDVWTEKPFALDRASGTSLLEAAAKADRRVATAPDTFLGAGLQSARRLLESGAVGDPLTALVLLQSAGPESWHPDPAFLFAEGAGPLFDLGPYYITALVQLLGPVGRVSATASKARPQRTIGSGPKAGQVFDVEVPTHVSALFEFEGGASATAVFSFDSAVNRTQLEVAGSGGTLELPDPNMFDGDTVVHALGEEPRSEAAVGSTASRGAGVLELARAIRAGRPERASGEQAFHVLDVMVSTIEAAQRRSPVEVESTTAVAPALPADWDPTARTL
ncbi:Gfo/Idh/MocA family protein [Quadrisphaera setariae]|uniref:Gfo/Idh/MocA family oxidoreductase n=1 Tax=Quadrisphaera setariae TaxID=2593304 RepID=A0A5C8Z6H0_9ACTN|nr:Gfo/Idh/MocA family oxidoreductase [Quadrisphaera setariae]TXR52899.1 Gfo/Idh/MocA family oxidoreductase [Quadrisphaera setariae]